MISASKLLLIGSISMLSLKSYAAITANYWVDKDYTLARVTYSESAPDTTVSSFYETMQRPEQSSAGYKYKEFVSSTGLFTIQCHKYLNPNAKIQYSCQFEVKEGQTAHSSGWIYNLQYDYIKLSLSSPESNELENIFPKNKFGRVNFEMSNTDFDCCVVPSGIVTLTMVGHHLEDMYLEIKAR